MLYAPHPVCTLPCMHLTMYAPYPVCTLPCMHPTLRMYMVFTTVCSSFTFFALANTHTHTHSLTHLVWPPGRPIQERQHLKFQTPKHCQRKAKRATEALQTFRHLRHLNFANFIGANSLGPAFAHPLHTIAELLHMQLLFNGPPLYHSQD